jgi:hypothetical protein
VGFLHSALREGDLIPTGNGLRPSFAQPVGEVEGDLIPVGEVVL